MGPGQFSPVEDLRIDGDRWWRLTLQWGRGNLAPERKLESRGKKKRKKASMGPGQFSPGEENGED